MGPRGQASTDAFEFRSRSPDARNASSVPPDMQNPVFTRYYVATFGLLALALALGSIFHFVARLQPLDEHVPGFIALMLLAGILYLLGVYIALSYKSRLPGLLVILGATVVFRLLFLPLSPTLPQDAYRYQWEGRVVRAHLNPCTIYPAMQGLSWARDPDHPIETGKTTPTLYPPVSEVVF